jgi:sugar porter (SP) family MFS transporter
MNKTIQHPVFIAIIVALGGFLLGFDGVVNGGAVPFYKSTFGIADSPILIGISSSIIILGGIMGNFSIGFLSERMGRKPILLMTSVLFMVGAAGTALSPNIGVFIIAKLIAGLGVGWAILVAPMYIAEIAPPKHRGWLVTFNQLNIVLGVSVAMFSNYFILGAIQDPNLNWRWMLGVGFFPAVAYFGLLFLVPESPRWLIQHGRVDEGKHILGKIIGEEQAMQEYAKIQENLSNSDQEEKATLKELFSRQMRYVLLIGFGLGIFQQLSGINAVLYYAPMVFANAGTGMDAAFLMAIAVGLTLTVATIISMFLIDRLGRKPLLVIGTSIIIVAFGLVTYGFNQGTYRLDEKKVQKITGEVYQSAVISAAQTQFPDNLLTQSLRVNIKDINDAKISNAGKLMGALDMSAEPMGKAKRDAKELRETLQKMQDITYRSEMIFFNTIKEELFKRYEPAQQGYIRTLYSESYKSLILNESINIDITIVLLGILGFIAGFSISLGPVMWAMFSEIFPNKMRARAIAVVGVANGLTSFAVATIFPIQLEYLGSASTYLIFGVCMVACLFFVIRYIPETKGKSLEELENELIREKRPRL